MDFLLDGPAGLVFAAAFGAAVGSYGNVVIHRSPREGMSSFRPKRSFCPGCNATIRWHDNVPVLSWLLLGGKCRSCRAGISGRYPAIELLVAGLFLGAWWLAPPVDEASTVRLAAAWYLAATCVIVSAIDLEHLIIPDTITYPGIALGLLASVALPALHVGDPGWMERAPNASSLLAGLYGLGAGGGSLAAVGLVGNIALKKRLAEAGVQDAMGWGDVKWMALAGSFLGVSRVLSAILLACFAGALVGLLLKAVARMRGAEAPVGVPFGPFLSIGILVELAAPLTAWSVLSGIANPA